MSKFNDMKVKLASILNARDIEADVVNDGLRIIVCRKIFQTRLVMRAQLSFSDCKMRLAVADPNGGPDHEFGGTMWVLGPSLNNIANVIEYELDFAKDKVYVEEHKARIQKVWAKETVA